MDRRGRMGEMEGKRNKKVFFVLEKQAKLLCVNARQSQVKKTTEKKKNGWKSKWWWR